MNEQNPGYSQPNNGSVPTQNPGYSQPNNGSVPTQNPGYSQPNNGSVPPQNPVYPQPNMMNMPPQNLGYSQPNMMNQTPQKKNKNIFIIIGIIIAVVAVAIACIFLFGNRENRGSTKKNRPEPSMERTIMIYMVGSDLEEKREGLPKSGRYASYELEKIKPQNIDLKNNNIIMIAGGSREWYNDYISPNETSIFQLKEDGFTKIKTDSVKNMGDPKTLTEFLNYAYEQFPAKKYELIFWDHGSGAAGLEVDTVSNDMIYTYELEQALKASPFNPEEKLDSILFINCLLGNIQIAGAVDDYAKYMVASEEVSYVSAAIDKFKFLENIEVSDTGYEFGKKFIDNLVNNTPHVAISNYYNTPTTYAVIDLSKIQQVESNLNSFVNSININQDYSTIAYARSNLYQYGVTVLENGMVDASFDMVDLYTIVSNLQSLSPTEANKLLESINQAVVYNYSNDKNSKGLATYFPYRGEKEILDIYVQLLSLLENGKTNDYLKFIQNFDLYKRTNSSYFMDVTGNTVNSVGNDYSMQFSDAQKKNFANASYMIFKQTNDGKFIPVYFSDNTTLDGNGKLKANFDGNLVTVLNPNTNVKEPIFVTEQKNGNYNTSIQLSANKSSLNASAIIKFTNNAGKIESVLEIPNKGKDNISLPAMSLLNLDDYQTISFVNHDYQITNDKGLLIDDWKEGKTYTTNASTKNYKVEKTPLNKNEKYYFAFKICDLSNEVTYSQLVPIK